MELKIQSPSKVINKEGKARRQASKSVLIGLIYGRGSSSIAEQTGKTKEETQDIINKFYKSYPRVKQWMDETHDFVHKNGYIDDVFGRRRRLPEAQWDKYKIEYVGDGKDNIFNPILECNNKINDSLINKYQKLLSKNLYKKDLDEVKRRAKIEGIEIHDNSGFISQAERQSVNFQCQSAGADMNKLALIAIDRSEEMKELGFTPLLTIHDEIIGQCPDENADKVAELLPKLLMEAGGETMKCPMKADSFKVQNWYEDDEISVLNDEYSKLLKDNNEEDAYNKLVTKHKELLESQIRGVMKEHKELLF